MMCNICTTLYNNIMTGKFRQDYEIKFMTSIQEWDWPIRSITALVVINLRAPLFKIFVPIHNCLRPLRRSGIHIPWKLLGHVSK
jgi:hypothetical protein